MTLRLKKHIDGIKTIEVMKRFITMIHSTLDTGKEAQEIEYYATNKLNHMQVSK